MACSRFSDSSGNRRVVMVVLATLTLPVLIAIALLCQSGASISSPSSTSAYNVWFAEGYDSSQTTAELPGNASNDNATSSEPRPALPTVTAGSSLGSPILDADLNLWADRAKVWKEGKQQMILLDRQVSFSMGTYGFRAEKAMVRIENEQSKGRLVRHVWMYLQNAQPLKGRGPLQGEAGLLLVTAVTTGEVGLLTNLLSHEQPADDPFIAAAHDRFTQYAWGASQPTLDVPPGQPVVSPEAIAQRDRRRAELAAIAQRYRSQLPPERLAEIEREEARPAVRGSTPAAGGSSTAAASTSTDQSDDGPRDRRGMILPTTGTVLFQYDRVAVQPMGEDELAIVFMGDVSVIYEPVEGRQGISLTASNAVVFVRKPDGIRGDLPDTRAASAQDIRGIYLEDNVQASNGQFNVRAPRVYYDLSRNKAVVLDAVMYAYDVRRQLPIYVRADKLRQESLQSWTAQGATLTTTEFAQPTLAIGARQITFTQETAGDGTLRQPFVAKDATVRLGNLPVFAWPRIGGDVTASLPIRNVDVGYRSGNGPFIETEWDLFALAGRPKPTGVDLTGSLDFLGERGPGVGVDLEYDLPRMFGAFEGYLLAYDQGEDDIGGRDDIEHDGDARGFYHWQHRQEIQGGWELSLESAIVTDETFLEEFFPERATEDKPWETSLYLKKQQDDWAFTFLGSYDLNDFTPQTTTLQAPGYRVAKLPELGYYRVGTSLWDDRLTYFSETTLSRMRLQFGGDSPRDRGFDNRQSLRNFGIPNTTSFGDAFRAAGLDSDWRTRFDSRHEIQAPMKWGFIDAVPFVSGRLTAYDDDFESFNDESDNLRFFGTTGIRLHSQFHRTYDDFDSRLLNVHRLRHIFEPMADITMAGSSYDPEDVPVYDDRVEALQEGASFRFGFRNTLQTQRGGPGRWRTVDWLVVNTDFVLRSEDANDSVIPEYYSYRPEFGKGGDHFHTDVMWMVSDTLAAVGEVVYDFEESQVAYWRIGASMEHSPVLTSFVEYSEIDSLSSRLLSVGANYRLTRKWSAGMRYTFDMARSSTRDIDVTLVREFSDWRLIMVVSHDAIDDRQSVSLVLVPSFTSNYRRGSLFSEPLAY